MKYSRYQVFEPVQSTRCSTCLKHCIAFLIKADFSRCNWSRAKSRWKYRPWKRCDDVAIYFPLSCPRKSRRDFKRNGRQKLSMLLRLVVPTGVFKNGPQFSMVCGAFSLPWPASIRIYWKKRKKKVIKDCQSYCTGETQARERRVVKR